MNEVPLRVEGGARLLAPRRQIFAIGLQDRRALGVAQIGCQDRVAQIAERTVMLSLTPGTPGRRQQMLRTIRSMATPAREAL